MEGGTGNPEKKNKTLMFFFGDGEYDKLISCLSKLIQVYMFIL